jgi:DNA-binding transcriptional ArsR family regulator
MSAADPVLRALAEPNRRAILELVRDEARPVGEIAAHFSITPQAVSQHLRVLRDAGLVEEQREGTRHLFVVRPEGFEPVREFLEAFWGSGLARLKRAAETAHRQEQATRAKRSPTRGQRRRRG